MKIKSELSKAEIKDRLNQCVSNRAKNEFDLKRYPGCYFFGEKIQKDSFRWNQYGIWHIEGRISEQENYVEIELKISAVILKILLGVFSILFILIGLYMKDILSVLFAVILPVGFWMKLGNELDKAAQTIKKILS